MNEYRSILKIIHNNGITCDFVICGNRSCVSNISSTAYSVYHASELGWRRFTLSVEEAKAYGGEYILFCPECVKDHADA